MRVRYVNSSVRWRLMSGYVAYSVYKYLEPYNRIREAAEAVFPWFRSYDGTDDYLGKVGENEAICRC